MMGLFSTLRFSRAVCLAFKGRSLAFATAALLGQVGGAYGQATELVSLNSEETDIGSVIQLDVADFAFEVSRVDENTVDIVVFDATLEAFEPINKSGRLARWVASAEVAPSEAGARLRLTLDCACKISTKLKNDRVVITARPPTDPIKAMKIALERTGQAAGGTLHAPKSSPLPPSRGERRTSTLSSGQDVDEDPVGTLSDEVEAARQSLLDQLSRAADQGLLTFRTPTDPAASPSANDEENEFVEFEIEPETGSNDELFVEAASEDDKAVRNDQDILLARTAQDVAKRKVERSEPRLICPSNRIVSLPDPRSGAAFIKAESALRSVIVDARGALNFAPLEELIRLYIANGFGLEALSLIKLAVQTKPEMQKKFEHLAEMARVIEGDPLGEDGKIAKWRSCGGDFSLWAEAAGLGDMADLPSEKRASDLLAALDETSRGTRQRLGAMLIEASLTRDDADTAWKIDEMLRRTPVRETPALALQRARLGLMGNATQRQAAWSTLVAFADSESEETLDALAALAAAFEVGDMPPPDLVSRIDDAFFLMTRADEQAVLIHDLVKLTALLKGVPSALEAAEKAQTAAKYSPDVLTSLVHVALESGREPSKPHEVAAYARSALSFAPYISTNEDGDLARTRAALTLSAAGFPKLADEIMAPVKSRDTAILERTRAEIAGETSPKVPQSSAEASGPAEGLEAVSAARTDAPRELIDPGKPRTTPEGNDDLLTKATESLAAAAETKARIMEALEVDG